MSVCNTTGAKGREESGKISRANNIFLLLTSCEILSTERSMPTETADRRAGFSDWKPRTTSFEEPQTVIIETDVGECIELIKENGTISSIQWVMEMFSLS